MEERASRSNTLLSIGITCGIWGEMYNFWSFDIEGPQHGRSSKLSFFNFFGGWSSLHLLLDLHNLPLVQDLPRHFFTLLTTGGSCFSLGVMGDEQKETPASHPVVSFLIQGCCPAKGACPAVGQQWLCYTYPGWCQEDHFSTGEGKGPAARSVLSAKSDFRI